jgi:hypothetical protein
VFWPPFCGRHPAVPAALEYEAAGLRPLAGLKRRLLRSRTGQDLREVDVVFHGRWQVLKIKQNPFLSKVDSLKQIFDVNYLFQVSVDLSWPPWKQGVITYSYYFSVAVSLRGKE